MGDIQVGASTRHKCRYHYVWGTKYRDQILTDPVAHHLKKIILGICQRYGYTFDV
jgi:REP element-mobilizing transposase RayT